jgi:hypothetical protein
MCNGHSILSGRLALLHTVVQVGCNLGADIKQQYDNRGFNCLNNFYLSRIFVLSIAIYTFYIYLAALALSPPQPWRVPITLKYTTNFLKPLAELE